MSDRERADYQTRFKKGQSGNPKGRPKGAENQIGQLKDVFFRSVRVKDQDGYRTVPKIVAAAEVCLNNALKGDLKAFAKIMELAHKYGLLDIPSSPPLQIVRITRTIVDPKISDTPSSRSE
jgi:hypothetical protein